MPYAKLYFTNFQYKLATCFTESLEIVIDIIRSAQFNTKMHHKPFGARAPPRRITNELSILLGMNSKYAALTPPFALVATSAARQTSGGPATRGTDSPLTPVGWRSQNGGPDLPLGLLFELHYVNMVSWFSGKFLKLLPPDGTF